MNTSFTRVLLLALWVGIGLGIIAAIWQLSIGASVASVLLWVVGSIALALLLAGPSVLGVRLQRKDLPPPT